MQPVSVVVEGPSDVQVVTRILELAGCSVSAVFGQAGCTFIDDNVARYNNAAKFSPWFVLRDLDAGACAVELVESLLERPAEWMRFRIAVREAEAWLIADADSLSKYLRISNALVPANPDTVDDPKQTLVNLARRSRKKAIVDDMVPEPGVSAIVGPGYVARITEFARDHWRPELARTNSDSLDRCIRRVAELAAFR